MPRQPRLDVRGTLNHVIVRGIDGSVIFRDDKDRERFIERLGGLVEATETSCYAWALIPNHLHLLLKSGPSGLSTFMRRLLTGYAVTFNKRHRRCGHLFQNRFKSIICEEDPYFLELVRYIHLNPLRSHVVTTMDGLDAYPWSGHQTLIGRASYSWQDRDAVLSWFVRKRKSALAAYRRFLEKGVLQGRRPELTGGGLFRSLGGMREVLERRDERVLTDERVLGTGEFVGSLVGQKTPRADSPLSERIDRMEQIVRERCAEHRLSVDALKSGSRAGVIPRLRAELALLLVTELGLPYVEIARRLGVSLSRISRIISQSSCK